MLVYLSPIYILLELTTDEKWNKQKTAFSMAMCHYEYQMIPYGFANALALFQSFVNMVVIM